jgi:hypothetical protein
MKNELIPPPDLAPPGVAGLPAEKRIELWLQLVDASEQFLLAGLRQKVGENGDVRAAYRAWYARRMEEHDRTMAHMLSELRRREGRGAG